MADARGGEAADADLEQHEIGHGHAAPRQLFVDFVEDGAVAFDRPLRRRIAGMERSVGDEQAGLAGLVRGGGGAADGVVVRSVDDPHRGLFALDGGDPIGRGAGGDENFRAEVLQARQLRNRAAVIAVGGGEERLHGGARGGAALLQRGVQRPRSAEDLE